MPVTLDHIIAIVFGVIYPAYSLIAYRRFRRNLELGKLGARRREYLSTTRWLSAMGLAVILFWVVQGRPLEGLGLVLPGGWRFWLGLGGTAIAALALGRQLGRVREDATLQAQLRAQAEALEPLVPRTASELGTFMRMSVAAGICEEIFFRGFLIWYVSLFTPLWAAMLISSLLFGFGHLYQGSQALLRIGLLGFILAGLYVFTGSLWVPIILHIAINVINSRILYVAFEFAGADSRDSL
jgi:membrane protease YdiL (CAAX protease family)